MEAFNPVFTSLIGLCAVIMVAMLSARFAAERVFNEKLWERKEKAYSDIISSLHDMARYMQLLSDAETEGHDTDNDFFKKLGERHTEANAKIQRATDMGVFLISEEAEAVLLKLKERKSMEPGQGPWFEYYADLADGYRTALKEIKVIALKDIGKR